MGYMLTDWTASQYGQAAWKAALLHSGMQRIIWQISQIIDLRTVFPSLLIWYSYTSRML